MKILSISREGVYPPAVCIAKASTMSVSMSKTIKRANYSLLIPDFQGTKLARNTTTFLAFSQAKPVVEYKCESYLNPNHRNIEKSWP
jgi:hypothetical protein